MAVKVFFIGNMLGGDDGIGPRLYYAMKDDPELKDYEMMEMGVIGFDLISYIEEGDKVIIVDAIHSNEKEGEVVVLGEEDLSPEMSLVSQHDFGVEETAAMLRRYSPELKKIHIIGINVTSTDSYSKELSENISKKFDKIKKEVSEKILSLSE
ncbi:MAG: hydrogenase maturation protease [Nanobdellota archaeon]